MIPTIKTLQAHFQLNRTEARNIRKCLELWGTFNETTRRNYTIDQVFELISEQLEAHGVEAIRGEWQNGYWCDTRAIYINMGDTYSATLVYDRNTNRVYATDYGSFVESLERKGENIP